MKETNCSIAHAQLHLHSKYSYDSIYKWIPNKNRICQKAGINNAKLTVHPGFENINELISIDFTNDFNTTYIENMDEMLFNCNNLNTLNISYLNTENA